MALEWRVGVIQLVERAPNRWQVACSIPGVGSVFRKCLLNAQEANIHKEVIDKKDMLNLG